ncbi:TetR family transcriptional regulator [Acinetobacter portensis]|uniref:TetR family transcriptional regulator n=2 Tax=Acinetobacter TaxID=469 RepID=A0A6L6GI99_9GAMM|nr:MULTISPECIES: TetR family transcriptional regulator [Acinetobacter]MCK7608982.1 TetR family transcriptional regulator [Acinetobacter portensis]MCK7639789.1 TetR family transcriptional regulator [Acinetobacter portensis]MDY6459616.1 TetR family transcriptional regulator [Acinetobacter faecalis]MDY6462576.1 TetR family transcriptional regulator [Acinetobacter faecalis]MDY6485258.1 TetR family transcriptional regulator [Acinetobacter faecalis]
MPIRDERKRQSRQAIIDAALRLSTSGRSFNSISLREISREIGLVPTAFYRHFKDMDALGLELVDQISLNLKSTLHQIGQSYVYQPEAKIDKSLELFFQTIHQHTEDWVFIITERWGASQVIRKAIAREIEYLVEDLAIDLQRLASTKHIQKLDDLKSLAHLVVNLAFNWVMAWIELSRQFEEPALAQQQQLLQMQSLTQMRLLFHGILNWESN